MSPPPTTPRRGRRGPSRRGSLPQARLVLAMPQAYFSFPPFPEEDEKPCDSADDSDSQDEDIEPRTERPSTAAEPSVPSSPLSQGPFSKYITASIRALWRLDDASNVSSRPSSSGRSSPASSSRRSSLTSPSPSRQPSLQPSPNGRQPPRTGVHVFCKHCTQDLCRCTVPLRPDGWGDYCESCWNGGCGVPIVEKRHTI